MPEQTIDFSKRPILVPVDFSPCSKDALLFACDFADRFQSPLLILHVVHDPITKPGFYRKKDNSDRMLPLDKLAGGMMKEFIDLLRNEQPELDTLTKARTMLVNGLPDERIPEVAVREDVAMIIMGSHGRTGLAHLLLGSVAEKVTKQSKVPVTIVKEQGRDGRSVAGVRDKQYLASAL